MNGKEIETTELGFFTQYVDLSLGNNTFTFTNNGKSKSITIVRQASDSSGSGSGASSSGITYWSKNHVAKYAVVKGNNISRMSTPGADGSSLMMPLASGTIAQIIGEAGNLYCLSDYSFVYKNNVTVKDGTLDRNTITGMHCNSMPVTANYNNAKGFLTFYFFNNNDAPEFINTYITNRVGIQKSSARYSNLAMTRMTGYPAVLFETSFMSNPSDYEWMINPETEKLFGVSAGEAVETYIKQIAEKNINTYA